MGTARAPVVGSGRAPACTDRVRNPGPVMPQDRTRDRAACARQRTPHNQIVFSSRTWRGEQLERDVVGVAEREARPVAGVGDLTVFDTELIEMDGPLGELVARGDAECDVVEAG